MVQQLTEEADITQIQTSHPLQNSTRKCRYQSRVHIDLPQAQKVSEGRPTEVRARPYDTQQAPPEVDIFLYKQSEKFN